MKKYNVLGILSGSTIKLIACLLMAIDHIGYHLFPNIVILRIIGRLSMPLFAFLIAEGCYYTKNKLKHFLLVFISGIVFLLGVKIFAGFWYYNIFLIFAISIIYIYLLQLLKNFSFKGNNKLIKSIFVLPHVGQETTSIVPFLYKSNDFKSSFPALISSTGLAVKETLNVSPIPSHKSEPMPIEDLIIPMRSVPDSVTPRWRG